MKQRLLILATIGVALAAPVAAQRRASPAPERPEVMTQLLACRAIAGEAERLACFDRQVAALEQAEASRAIAVVDRQQIRRTRRSLFGLTLPDLGIFGGDDDEGDDGAGVNEINTTLRSSGSGADGRMVYRMEDNSIWVQTEGRRSPRYVESQEERIRLHLIPYFGNMGLSEIKPGTVLNDITIAAENTPISTTAPRCPPLNRLLALVMRA